MFRLFTVLTTPIPSSMVLMLFGAPAMMATSPARAQSAPGGMCLEVQSDGNGFRNTCPYDVSYSWCIINPVDPRIQEGSYHYGQGNCGNDESNGRRLEAGGFSREGRRSSFFGGGVVWLECRPSNGMITFNSTKTGRLIRGSRPHFQRTCMRADGQIVPGFTATSLLHP